MPANLIIGFGTKFQEEDSFMELQPLRDKRIKVNGPPKNKEHTFRTPQKMKMRDQIRPN